MDLTDELHGNSPIGSRQDEQAVIICLQFPRGKLEEKKALDAVFDLDDIFRTVVEASGVGTYEGHEFREGPDGQSVKFVIFGKNAGRIYKKISPILHALPILPGSYIIKRYSHISKDQFTFN